MLNIITEDSTGLRGFSHGDFQQIAVRIGDDAFIVAVAGGAWPAQAGIAGSHQGFRQTIHRFPAADTLDRVVLAAVVGDGEERPAVLFGDTDIIDGKGNFLCHRRLTPPARLTWRSFRYGMLVCHQAFYARTDIARSLPYDTAYRYSADVDWCIRVMKEGEQRGLLLRNIHAVVADYVQEGQTTLHHKESLRERFDVMRRHYGLLQTVLLHAWFAVRSLVR